MDMSREQADYLLSLPKFIVEGRPKEKIMAKSAVLIPPVEERWQLEAPAADEFTFLWKFEQSRRNLLKLTLYIQEHTENVGLLRIDLCGARHTNPVMVTEEVPADLAAYAGMTLSAPAGHIHYHVRGYPSLKWAKPLSDDHFPVKELRAPEDLMQAVSAFAQRINLLTELELVLTPQLLS